MEVTVNLIKTFTYANKNSSLSKEQINVSNGEYPVYSASVGKIVGFIDTYCNNKPSIIIPTAGNGSAGKPYIVKDQYYSVGANAVGLIPNDNIDIDYLYIQIKKNIQM